MEPPARYSDYESVTSQSSPITLPLSRQQDKGEAPKAKAKKHWVRRALNILSKTSKIVRKQLANAPRRIGKALTLLPKNNGQTSKEADNLGDILVASYSYTDINTVPSRVAPANVGRAVSDASRAVPANLGRAMSDTATNSSLHGIILHGFVNEETATEDGEAREVDIARSSDEIKDTTTKPMYMACTAKAPSFSSYVVVPLKGAGRFMHDWFDTHERFEVQAPRTVGVALLLWKDRQWELDRG